MAASRIAFLCLMVVETTMAQVVAAVVEAPALVAQRATLAAERAVRLLMVVVVVQVRE